MPTYTRIGKKATVIRWKTIFGDVRDTAKWVKHGAVENMVGDTIQIKFVLFNFILFKLYRKKWFSFRDKHYRINVEEV